MIDALRRLYGAVERRIAAAGPVCEASGRCCRFREFGHRLYLTRPEAELLLADGLPATGPFDDAGCPFQIDRLCTARDGRPLACRVYFCDPSYEGVGEEIMEAAIAELRQLHEAHGRDWEYAPLHVFLNEAAQGWTPTPPADTPTRGGTVGRVPLPLVADAGPDEGPT